jgi:SnoaL-like protein
VRVTRLVILTAVVTLLPIPSAVAQRQSDTNAINRLIDQYGATEDAMDMVTQARLMSADRVWIGSGAGRQTDQATNMRVQQAYFDMLKKRVPGVQTFTEDRDRLIKFYANGAVAIASFYRYTNLLTPPNTPREDARELENTRPVAITLVLERQGSDWKIVHTHVSELSARN